MNMYQKMISEAVDEHGKEIIKVKAFEESENTLCAVMKEIIALIPNEKQEEYYDRLEIAINGTSFIADYFYYGKGFQDGLRLIKNATSTSDSALDDLPFD